MRVDSDGQFYPEQQVRGNAVAVGQATPLSEWVMNARTLNANTDPMALIEESLSCQELDLQHLVTKEHH